MFHPNAYGEVGTGRLDVLLTGYYPLTRDLRKSREWRYYSRARGQDCVLASQPHGVPLPHPAVTLRKGKCRRLVRS
ncbi:hypothetical protein VUR80DRAFT_8842 [Thermomyces stellatus]